MSQGSSFIGKIFGGKKEEKVFSASYRAGRRRGLAELGKVPLADDSSSSASSSDEEVYHDNAVGDQTFGGSSAIPEAKVAGSDNAAGNAVGSNFNTDETSYGATHGQQGTNSSSSGKISPSLKGKVVSQPPKVNRQPLEKARSGDYADGKAPVEVSTHTAKNNRDKGPINNLNPRYGNNATPVKGVGQFFDPRDTQGGLYKPGAGKEPSTHGNDPVGVTATSASASIPGGVSEGGYGVDSQATHAQLQMKDLKTKPTAYAQQESFEKNQQDVETDAYNAGRRKGLANTGSSSKDQSSQEGNHVKSLDPKNEHAKNKSAFNAAGVQTASSEITGGSGKESCRDEQGTGVSSQHESGKNNSSNAGKFSSSKPGGYEKEIERIDRSIASTQREIDALEENTPSIHQSLNPADQTHDIKQGTLGGPGYTGAGRSKARNTFPDERKPAGNREKVKVLVPSYATETEPINAGHFEESGKSSDERHGTSSSSNTGFFSGIADAASAAGNKAASAFGLGDSTARDKPTNGQQKSVNIAHQPLTNQDDRIAHPDIRKSQYNAHDVTDRGSESKIHDSKHSNPEHEEGYLDSAKAALSAAGASAASALGYEGHDKHRNAKVHSKHAEKEWSIPSSDRDSLVRKDQAKAKPSTTSAGDQHPSATALSGGAAMASIKDSGNTPRLSSHQQGLDSEKSSSDAKSKSNASADVESTTGAANEDGSSNQREESEENTSVGVDNTDLEADIAAYNKKHGYTTDKSLLEVAEESYPEIKQEPSHKDGDGVLEAPVSKNPSAIPGAATTIVGQKLAEEERANKAKEERRKSNDQGSKNSDAKTTRSKEGEGLGKDAIKKAHVGDKGMEKEAYDAGYKHGLKLPKGSLADTDVSKQHNKGHENDARPIVEVIGIADQDKAKQIASQTTRDLLDRGEDLTGHKIVIDANKKEVHKQPQSGVPGPNPVTHSAIPSGNLSGTHSSHTKPDASFYDSPKDEDGSGYHRSHEKVKRTLEHEAEKGNLGPVPAEDDHQSRGASGVPHAAFGGASGFKVGPDSGNQAMTSGHLSQPDASYMRSPKEDDGSRFHQAHEQVKDKLEHEAEAGHLGNIGSPKSPQFLSADDKKHSYSHKNESPGKEATYTEVIVQGEPDTKRASVLAKDAVGCLKGRPDIINVRELKVDAYTGSITDQDGHFIGQLSQRRLSQVESGIRRVSSGGLVSLHGGPGSPNRSSKPFKPKGLDEMYAAAQNKTPQGPFSEKYNIASAQGTGKTGNGNNVPGSYL